MNFPPELPAACPLPSSKDCSGSFYMVCREDPIREEDCLSQAERGRAPNATGDAACTRHGLSVFMSYDACVHQRELFPHLGKRIAHAMLDASHGKSLSTPSNANPGHSTWWPYANLSRSTLFAVIKES